MAAIDLTGQLREWVAKAIRLECFGEDFGYDTSLRFQPPRLAWTVIITMGNPLLGQGPVVMPFSVDAGSLSEENIREAVSHVLAELRKMRRALLDGPAQRAMPSHN